MRFKAITACLAKTVDSTILTEHLEYILSLQTHEYVIGEEKAANDEYNLWNRVSDETVFVCVVEYSYGDFPTVLYLYTFQQGTEQIDLEQILHRLSNRLKTKIAICPESIASQDGFLIDGGKKYAVAIDQDYVSWDLSFAPR